MVEETSIPQRRIIFTYLFIHLLRANYCTYKQPKVMHPQQRNPRGPESLRSDLLLVPDDQGLGGQPAISIPSLWLLSVCPSVCDPSLTHII